MGNSGTTAKAAADEDQTRSKKIVDQAEREAAEVWENFAGLFNIQIPDTGEVDRFLSYWFSSMKPGGKQHSTMSLTSYGETSAPNHLSSSFITHC